MCKMIQIQNSYKGSSNSVDSNDIVLDVVQNNQESVASSVIKANGMMEFEDGLWTGVLPRDCWCPCGNCT